MIVADSCKMPELPADILRLVFQELVGNNETLLNIELTCSAWHSLALPSVCHAMDISSHNNGRQPQLECATLTALNDNAFPLLKKIRFEGFCSLERADLTKPQTLGSIVSSS